MSCCFLIGELFIFKCPLKSNNVQKRTTVQYLFRIEPCMMEVKMEKGKEEEWFSRLVFCAINKSIFTGYTDHDFTFYFFILVDLYQFVECSPGVFFEKFGNFSGNTGLSVLTKMG